MSYNTATPPVPTYDPTTLAILKTQISAVSQLDASRLDATQVGGINIETGDIMFLDNAIYQQTGEDDAHTVFVAGWGPALTSWSQLASGSPQLYLNYSQAHNALGPNSNPVPYVIDHGPAGVPTSDPTGNSPFVNPRPYYMLWWRVPSDTTGTKFLRLPMPGNVAFLHIPDTLDFATSPPPSTPYTATYVLYPPTALDPTQLINGHR